jgi:NAD(P)-dependent dehydrogenase (short-subunit alcohol dehydrogenase family)
VILACRNAEKAARAVDEVIRATGNRAVRWELVDVSREDSVVALAERWRGPLHVLVNNAAVTPRRRQETAEGIELQFATNVLGYFWMIQAFSEILQHSAPSRVVNVASYWAGDLDLTDLEFRAARTQQRGVRQPAGGPMLTVVFAERSAVARRL